jgi:hypothetical protein
MLLGEGEEGLFPLTVALLVVTAVAGLLVPQCKKLRQQRQSTDIPQEGEGDPFVVKKTLAISNTSAARATFLAGYTYYEIGRYSAASSFWPYPFVLALCFASAVLAAATAAWISYHTQRLITQGRMSEAMMRRLTFAENVQDLVKLCQSSFQVALLCFTVSISMIGARYYPECPGKWITAGFGGVAVCGMLLARGYVHLARRFVKHAVISQQAEDEEAVGRSSSSEGAAATLKEANATALNSLLVLAFAQAAVARYQPYLNFELFNYFYLVSVCTATLFAIFATFSATTIVNFMNEFPPAHASLCMRYMLPFLAFCKFCLAAALVMMMAGVSCMGWGVSYNCVAAPYGPSSLQTETCYHTLRYVPATAGLTGVICFVFGYIYVHRCVQASEEFARLEVARNWREVSQEWRAALDHRLTAIERTLQLMAEGGEKRQASKSSGDDGSNPALDEAKLAEAEKQLSALLIAASTYAGQGTIAASTIFCKY